MIARLLGKLRRDRRGATIVEFAIVAPVMLALIMGLGELAYQGYVQAILSGAIQKAGRDSTIQGNDAKTDDLDSKVMTMVRTVAKNASYTSSRKNYAQFEDAAGEYYFDDNRNGVYDRATECFIDVNNNQTYDADPGAAGQGGASDVTVYKLTLTYPRLFPVKVIGWSATATISASTILKNQPYASQTSLQRTKICPPPAS